MTQKTYAEVHGLTNIPYQPKHAKRMYHVWRVLTVAGPQEEFDILGRDDAIQAVNGCWDWEITSLETGEIVRICGEG